MKNLRTSLPGIGMALTLALSIPGPAVGQERRPELGTVQWGRDLDAALERSRHDGRPVFLLFQEVPG